MLQTDPQRALDMAEAFLGLDIKALPNVSQADLSTFLYGLFSYSRVIPPNTQHVIVGHGYGHGENWRFFGGEKVQDYVNRHIPRGEAAWAVVCESGNARRMSLLEGTRLVSQGV
jgi:hypothetical protein